MFLDVDNVGTSNTIVDTDGSSKPIPDRTEVTTIRGIMPGVYSVNVHEYHKGEDHPEDVKVKVIKLNPYSVISESTKTFDAEGEEQTFCNFTVASDGSVSDVFLSPVKMVGQP